MTLEQYLMYHMGSDIIFPAEQKSLHTNLIIALTSRVAVNLLAMEMSYPSFNSPRLVQYLKQSWQMLNEGTMSALFLKSPHNKKTDIGKAKCKKQKLISKL